MSRRLDEEGLALANGGEVDAELASDVLSVRAGEHGTWVINRHSASQQIWLSSPLSGPRKFLFNPTLRTWVNERDATDRLHDRLCAEFARISGDAKFSFGESF